jgi:hypothetical protein
MKSKSYILMQIKDILIDHKSYTREKAERYTEELKEKTVYELLVFKKQLMNEDEEHIDVSYRRSIWHEEED